MLVHLSAFSSILPITAHDFGFPGLIKKTNIENKINDKKVPFKKDESCSVFSATYSSRYKLFSFHTVGHVQI